MTELIWDFNEFMSRDFKSLAMGLTPSGHIHLGFLTTLACAFMYIREHPKCHLIITNVENSLASDYEKYNGVPLRFQFLEEGGLIIPKDYEQLKKRNAAASVVHGEVTSLIWKLAQIFDKITKKELELVKSAFIPPQHKKWLELKENKVLHVFGTQIYIYSFIRVLERDRPFRNNLIRYLVSYPFAQIVGPLAGILPKVKNFSNTIQIKAKEYQAKCFSVPVRLYCPNCHNLCPDWAVVVLGHPYHPGPTFAARCKNLGECPRADMHSGYDGYVYHSLGDALDMAEFHFMLDPMRDFFQPFLVDCHIFGGDYFQLTYTRSGVTAVDKIKLMFEFLEQSTGQSKFIFGGPLITINGMKMSKSGKAFNIKDIENLRMVFQNIVTKLEEFRSQSFPNGIKIEYTDIIKKAA